MHIRLRQQTQQSQAVTHQVIQAVEVLEYDQDELETFVREQVERNPLLRLTDTADTEAPTHAAQIRLHSGPVPRLPASGTALDTQELLEGLRAKTTLQDHLRRQASLLHTDAGIRQHVHWLIDSLDPDGYLRTGLEDLAPLLETTVHALEEALGLVQTLDPAGVGARSLAECLRLQLKEQGRMTPALDALLAGLDLVAAGDLKRLARHCGVAIDELPPLLDLLRQLDPKPGHRFGTDAPLPALPDVIVSIRENGGIRIEINTELLPRIALDREYFTELSAQARDPNDIHFLQACYRDANALIHNLDQRAQTTLKIATEAIRNQVDFLFHGDGKLRPLSQKDIARLVGVHESTVSRTIANRHVLCPQGQFPLKHLFSEKLPKGDSQHELSATAIRHHIKRLMSLETPEHILSDEDIVNSLRENGVEIARRTVAKYRSQLRIPSSADRRRRLRLAAATEIAREQRP